MTLSINAIPIPADGTIELLAGDLELDKLDLLFKAQVDVGGLPGQVHEAQITFTSTLAKLSCVIEEVESGELVDFDCEATIEIPKESPEAGGPKPIPSDDAELDWEDDDTLEAMLGVGGEDAGSMVLTPTESEIEDEDVPEAPSKPPGKGLDALLKALLSVGSGAESEEPEDDFFSDDMLADDESEETDQPQPVLDPANARGLLDMLIRGGDLELEDGFTVDNLIAGAAPIVAGMKPATQKAEALSEWLFKQDSVAEVYMDDESLASLLEQW